MFSDTYSDKEIRATKKIQEEVLRLSILIKLRSIYLIILSLIIVKQVSTVWKNQTAALCPMRAANTDNNVTQRDWLSVEYYALPVVHRLP